MARVTVKTATTGAGEEPESFVLLEKCFAVQEVIDRWFGDEYAYFKVRGEDGVIYILRYSLDEAEWEMVVMDAAMR